MILIIALFLFYFCLMLQYISDEFMDLLTNLTPWLHFLNLLFKYFFLVPALFYYYFLVS